MAKHTPTPWHHNYFEVLGADNFCVFEYMDIDEDEANGPRIVAAVNAFHSPDGREIPTEAITQGLFWEMRDLLHHIGYEPIGNPNTDAMTCLDIITEKARALLAKLEPQK